MAQHTDTLIRFLLPQAKCRGAIIRGQHIIQDACSVHGLAAEPGLLFGQSLLASMLLLSISKGGVRQVLQLDSCDQMMPVQRILAESRSGAVRGYIQWQENQQAQSPETAPESTLIADWMGANLLISTVRDLGFGQPYISTIEHQSNYIADHLVHYLQQSVQVRADIVLQGDMALMLEAMPGCDDDAWFRAVEALAAISNEQLASQTPKEVLTSFDALGCQIVGEDAYRYQCSCSLERMEQTLRSMNPESLKEMSDNAQDITLSCQYCQSHYTFALDTL